MVILFIIIVIACNGTKGNLRENSNNDRFLLFKILTKFNRLSNYTTFEVS